MHRRFSSLLSVFTLCLSVLVGANLASAADKPNILFLFADDMCYELIGSLGYTDVDTPHLDKLVEGGTTFTRTYNMGSWSGAVCVASRTMLNTGRYIWRANKLNVKEEQKAGRLWSQMMKKAGYETYFTGKWHVKASTKDIFDHERDTRGGMPNQTKTRYNRPMVEGQPDTWDPTDPKFEGFWKGGKHWSEVVADHAVDYLDMAKKSDKPFFMYLAFNAVHDPRQSPGEYIKRYPLSRIKLPQNFLPEYPFKDAIKCGKGLRDEKLAPFPRTPYSIKVNRQEYYAITTHMDAQIGRILDALEKSGKADNTWIFFTADHGLGVGQHGFLGKQNLYEHSVRVPFMVVGPNVPKNKKNATPINLQDVMATSLDLAGIKADHVEFESLVPILKSGKSVDKPVYGAYLDVQRMITMDGYKLLAYPKAKKLRLYHIAQDPLELKDLIDDPTHKDRIKTLFNKLIEMQKAMNDSKADLKAVFKL